MAFEERTFGDVPPSGRSLWISMHGGGGTTAEVNDGQYRNQIKLYDPAEGIWVIPRSPTDRWNMWHESHIDALFDRIIQNYVLTRGVNPDRVYLVGYSAGGDGVYQLAPRMADRFAAAAMMAGHPNDASPLGLRNLPFAAFVGGRDSAYKRNEVTREWGARLGELKKRDSAGYEHWVQIYEGLGHWMNRKDAEALPWMARFTRAAWPTKVVWQQDDVTHSRMYWLGVPRGAAKQGQKITAEVTGQIIRISAEELDRLDLRLRDTLLSLDETVTIFVNETQRFQGKIQRTREAIVESLTERADPVTAATATLSLKW
jgi:dienelactone hydrolase